MEVGVGDSDLDDLGVHTITKNGFLYHMLVFLCEEYIISFPEVQ